jgi:Flp pilus assembly protein TadD
MIKIAFSLLVGVFLSIALFHVPASAAPTSGHVEKTAEGTKSETEKNADQSSEQKAGEPKVGANEAASNGNEQQEAENLRHLAETRAVEHLHLSHRYLARWDFDLAEVELQEAIICLPELKVVHRDYCLLAVAKGKPVLALAEFMLATGIGDPIPYTEQETNQINARAAKLHYEKALSYGSKRRWPAAVFELQLASNYAPENPNIKHSLAFAYAMDGKMELAEAAYKQSFEMAPADAFMHADFAYLLSDEGKEKGAYEQIARAVELQPKSAALHIDLAWFSENKGELERASAEIREAIKLSPNHAGLWAHLGRVLEKKGDSAGAKDAYTHALTLDPNESDAKAALAKLDLAGS